MGFNYQLKTEYNTTHLQYVAGQTLLDLNVVELLIEVLHFILLLLLCRCQKGQLAQTQQCLQTLCGKLIIKYQAWTLYLLSIIAETKLFLCLLLKKQKVISGDTMKTSLTFFLATYCTSLLAILSRAL